MQKSNYFALLLGIVCNLQAQTLIQDPNLNQDASKMAFSYQGDIWTSEIDGTNPKRLTLHQAYDSQPFWIDHKDEIAFISKRFGNANLFTIPNKGGQAKRYTYYNVKEDISDIHGDEIIFSTNRNFVQIERDKEIFSVNLKGGTPQRILNSLGSEAVVSPNNNLVAFVKGTCRNEREAYRGAANKNIWVYNKSTDKYFQITDFQGQDFSPKWIDDTTLAFQSSRDGKYNIHTINLDAQGNAINSPKALTKFTKTGISSYSISGDGTTAIALQRDKIFRINTRNGQQNIVSLSINSEAKLSSKEHKSFHGNVKDISISPNGNFIAMQIRGEIFIKSKHKDFSRTINLSKSSFKDESPVWLNDDTLLFVSDRNGKKNIFKVISGDKKEKNLMKSLNLEISSISNSPKDKQENIQLSPDKKKISFIRNRQLIVADISKKAKITQEFILSNNWAVPQDTSWSPDSRFIAYSQKDLYFNSEIFIHKADNSQERVNVSMHPKDDYNPVWTKDGSKLAFNSERNNGDTDIWFTYLKEDDWFKTQLDRDFEKFLPDEKEVKKEEKEASKKTNKIKEIEIDFENIHERQVQLTSFSGGEYLEGVSSDSKTFYYTTGNSGPGNAKYSSDLYSIEWDNKKSKQISKGDLHPSNLNIAKKQAYFIAKGQVKKLNLGNSKIENLPFNANLTIDYSLEKEQIFEEAWQLINDKFYDPNFHGQDWEALKSEFKPLAMKASNRTDFTRIFNQMLGQINASHMGMYESYERENPIRSRTPMLGIELKNVEKGLEITAVTPEMPADRAKESLKIGDIITAVNGIEVTEDLNFYSLLGSSVKERLVLDFTRKGSKKQSIIQPQKGNRNEKYKAWVSSNRKRTDKYSKGRLGYIHIRAMNWSSFEAFERDLTAAGYGKEGIVIDVRYNGGGWTTDYLMAILTVKQHAYTVPRGAAKNLDQEHLKFKNTYPFSERLPLSAWNKPSVALCNQNSYSNAEIFSHAYQNLKIGKLVGTPTFGAVISTSGQSLIDGSFVRIPFRGWYNYETEQNMDVIGAQPDLLVYNQPDEKSKGIDSQLKAAVNSLLKDLDAKK